MVRVDKFNDSSIDIIIYGFTNTNNWKEFLKIKEDLAIKIKEIVEGNDCNFAFPSRTIYSDK
jgi:MscS family membrane protein